MKGVGALSKCTRSLSLILVLILSFSLFSVNAFASEAENLVNSDLTQWTTYNQSGYGVAQVVLSQGNSGAYYVSVGNVAKYYLIYDLPDLKIDTSYTFSFVLHDNDTTYSFFYDYDLYVCVGSLDGGYIVEADPVISYCINASNYKNFTSTPFSMSFKLNSVVGTPCVFLYMVPKDDVVEYYRGYYIKNIQLVSNSSATDEKLDGVLGWLQELWNSITEGFSNLAADFKQGINNTISELQVTWQQITSKIEQIKDNLVGEIQASWQQTVNKMTSMVESISGFFDNLGASFERLINKLINYLLYFDDEVPENPFKSEDSVLSDLHSFIDNIVFSIEMFSNDIEDVIDSISASAQIFTDFVEDNDWLWIIVVVVLGFIVVSRFIGL